MLTIYLFIVIFGRFTLGRLFEFIFLIFGLMEHASLILYLRYLFCVNFFLIGQKLVRHISVKLVQANNLMIFSYICMFKEN